MIETSLHPAKLNGNRKYSLCIIASRLIEILVADGQLSVSSFHRLLLRVASFHKLPPASSAADFKRAGVPKTVGEEDQKMNKNP